MLKTVSSIANALGALNYKGTWNASTNVPTLASGVGTQGDYYVVSVAGSTDLDGVTNWGVGDWAAFNGSVWQRLEGGADGNFVNLTVSNTATVDGLATFNGNAQFPDNSKAIFGAGSDLEIYHSGAASIIADVGTGNLVLQAGDFRLKNADSTETMILANAGSTVQLYHDNAVKLATTATGIDVTGTATMDGLTVDGNAQFPDNSKAIFGDNDDLQIYSDGSHSYIKDTGTGDLRVYAQDFQIRNADGSNTMLYANAPTGGIQLFHTGAEKLATTATGIDVTGSVTADGLSVDGDGLFDADNAKVEIKSFAPKLTFTDDSAVGAAADKFIIQSVAAQSAGDYEFVMNNDQTSSADVTVAKFFGNGDISFYNLAGTSQNLFWDSSTSRLGLGTTNPSAPLHIVASAVAEMRYGAIGPSSNSALRISRNDSTTASGNPLGYLEFGGNDATGAVDTSFAYVGAEASGTHAAGDNPTDLVFGTTADGSATVTERMRIDASGHAIIPAGVTLGTATGVYDAAKTLDDYEEGTFTPVVADATSGGNTGTASTADGFYTKIGNMVYLSVTLLNVNTSGMTAGNAFYIRSLPFTSSTGNAGRAEGSIRSDSVTFAGSITANMDINDSWVRLADSASGVGDVSLTVAAINSGVTDLFFSIAYQSA